jgi:hypothetical protein
MHFFLLTVVACLQLKSSRHSTDLADLRTIVRRRTFLAYLKPMERQPAGITFSKDNRTLSTDGFMFDIVLKPKVQGTDVKMGPCQPWDDDNWTWDIKKITARLIDDGGHSASNQTEHTIPEDLRRSVERTIYSVMIAGQISTYSGWKQHHVRYPDENAIGVRNSLDESNMDIRSLESEDDQQNSTPSLNSKDVSRAKDRTSLKPMGWKNLLFHAQVQTAGRTLKLSSKRYLGLVPMATEPGNHIFVLDGLLEPAILRPREDGAYTLIGVAYVHGIMEREWQATLSEGYFEKDV